MLSKLFSNNRDKISHVLRFVNVEITVGTESHFIPKKVSTFINSLAKVAMHLTCAEIFVGVVLGGITAARFFIHELATFMII